MANETSRAAENSTHKGRGEKKGGGKQTPGTSPGKNYQQRREVPLELEKTGIPPKKPRKEYRKSPRIVCTEEGRSQA